MPNQSLKNIIEELVSVMPNDLLIKIYFDNLNIRCDEATMKKRQKLNMEFNSINNNFIEEYVDNYGHGWYENDYSDIIYTFTYEYLEYIKYDQYR
tara:strand:+ start:437 stop:721 length:285 start_codon:yes stop_codon:yes gene_type:complete